MRLAIVEDDPDAIKIFARRFKEDGYTCDEFRSAEEALPAMLKSPYDALIVDIRLPSMSGIELLDRLRQAKVFAPCVMITAFNSLPLARQALNASANYLLEKPFRYESLKRAVEKVLQSPGPLQLHADRSLNLLSLTEREEEIARLLLKGFSNMEIANILKLSEKTVKQYVGQIYEKSGSSSRAEFFSHIFPV